MVRGMHFEVAPDRQGPDVLHRQVADVRPGLHTAAGRIGQILLLLLLVVGCSSETAVEQAPLTDLPVVQPGADEQTNRGEESPVNRSSVDFEQGRLSVSAEDESLPRLSAEISRKTGVQIHLIEEYSDLTVSAEIDRYPLDSALRLLLKDVNTIFVYRDPDERKDGPTRLADILLLPPGSEDSDPGSSGMNLAPVARAAEKIQASLLRPDISPRANHSLPDPGMQQSIIDLRDSLERRLLNSGQVTQ